MKFLLLIFLLLSTACDKMNNEADELKLFCGIAESSNKTKVIKIQNYDVDPASDKIFVYDGPLHEPIGPISLNAKKCFSLNIEDTQEITVSIPSKHLAAELNFNQSKKNTLLLDIDNTEPKATLDLISRVVSPNTGIIIQTSENAQVTACFDEQNAQGSCLGVKLGASLVTHSNSIQSPTEDGEYTIKIQLEDRAGNRVYLNENVTIDSQRPSFYPDFIGITAVHHYMGESRHYVARNYKLNFASKSDSLRDLTIRYCFFQETHENTGQLPDSCAPEFTKTYGIEDSPRFDQGAWILLFKGTDKAGNSSSDQWSKISLFVENECTQMELISRTKPMCTKLDDNLIVSTEISSLAEFKSLIEISGSLNISNNSFLKDLHGLENLISVGTLELNSNANIESLDGLSSLQNIFQSIKMKNNPRLSRIDTLKNVTRLSGTLDLVENDSLASLSGLDNIQSIGETFYLQASPLITSINELSKLQSVGEVHLIWLDNLKNIHGLRSLSKIVKFVVMYVGKLESFQGMEKVEHLSVLNVTSNSSLASFQGLEGLSRISEDLSIVGNEKLKNLVSLRNLISLESSALAISDNEELTSTSGPCLRSVAGDISIANNAKLQDIGILACLETAGGNLDLSNLAVSSFHELSNLKEVKKSIRLSDSNSVSELGSLSNLSQIGLDLSIVGMSIKSLKGLEALKSIQGSLVIKKNTALERLNGLDSLVIIGSILKIEDNSALTSTDDLNKDLKVNTRTIRNNAMLTNSNL
ncbi:MAG: hypothetical protein V4655_00220 [Bdellovibrionota bacterium]